MRRLIAALLGLFLIATQAQAEPNGEEKALFRQIISDQMSAFRADDAAAAFAFASPSLQAKFGKAETFLEMVRSGYAPVYRPRSVEFRDPFDRAGATEQPVFVIGPDSRAYLAHYIMERQPDGAWRISGCFLERIQDESV